ncbi:hypothetical protein CC85DRAFT_289006 [Cutaneotrichosporon oleaginosum]|uniref:Zf-C3HC-domain-containing protein n=1 Tax=Cutaneotrichosporon oleaginosum TaxID=879819 RepID=A0A0J0XD26_9TREE|nr:uncharacterized protein CC85DRAFT_289006 [Cutaneotrichosporon oleaginosum]KLT38976.1 hypothetical protein CC85DRAFT_289006 [Cutaneotrichosporon oleaginosum]TXT14670.1 hypothetical protein COLE_00863 [Cutaneotrichosporon oleaginosum]
MASTDAPAAQAASAPRDEGALEASTPTRTPEAPADEFDADLVADLHDAFGMMYAGSEWDSDDEEQHPKRTTDGFDLPSLLSELAALISFPQQAGTKRRLFPPRTRAPSVFPSTSPIPPLPPATAYLPFSPLPLLARLRTFGASGLSPTVPPEIGALACALHGWVSAGRDALACAHACGATWGVGGLSDLRPAVRDGVVRRLKSTLSSRHAPGCAWRITASPPELPSDLRRILHPLTATSLAPLSRALAQQSLSGPLAPVWSSPVSGEEIQHLAIALRRHLPPLGPDPESENRTAGPRPPEPKELLASALALFGWFPYDPSFPTDHVLAHGTPTDIVACRICRRRVGLWSFAPEHGRALDLGAAHVSWCPLRAEGWWRESALVAGRREGILMDPKTLGEMLIVSDDGRPKKKWRRR